MDKSGLKSEDLDRFVRFMESARTLAASATLAAMCGAIYEYLALMGVADVTPARAVLVCAWFFGSMFVWEMLTMPRWSKKARRWTMGLSVILLALVSIGSDRLTIRWQMQHPSEIIAMRDELRHLDISVQQLTTGTGSQRVTSSQPEIKEVTQLPGYLKLKFSYPRLPVEQANAPALLDAYYVNYGSTYVHGASVRGKLFYVDFKGVHAPQHAEDVETSIKDVLAKMEFPGRSDVAPGDAVWSSYETPLVLTEAMIQAMNLGTARIYFAALVEWTGVNGVADHVTTCKWLQPSAWSNEPRGNLPKPDMSKLEPVWHEC